MKELIASLSISVAIRRDIERDMRDEHAAVSLEEIKLCSPITDPEKIICIGLNYYDHVLESNMQVPVQPILFPKFNNCIVGPEDEVVIPAETKQCDYEVELAFVVGRKAKNVPIGEAMNYVFGYTIMNDVSARDIQLSEGQWTRGKAIDSFAPIGPYIVTADEIPDPHDLRISLTLNGKTMQDSNTKELIFNIPFLLSFLSRTMTLQPGDVISTGTPPGVGMGKNPQVWLSPGDVTEAYIQGIGILRNYYAFDHT
ncbi:fumarylacetoacetate hydrolase family protein [Paenibacillus solisilvae]|uniref:Fumarylacetoacetate hydrolase family protein n=1 Tax=Paenibacillus solisilvae TaxID=2486751 RepID=A0ABW0W213_9BACL